MLHKAAQLAIPSLRRAPSMMEKIITKGAFDGRFEDREHVIGRFLRHTEQVKGRVPPERLLVYEVGEGWPSPCAISSGRRYRRASRSPASTTARSSRR